MGNSFIVRVSTAELSQALKSIDVYDGKTRLKVEKALLGGTRRVASGARTRVAVRSGKLKRSIKTSFSRVKLEGHVKAVQPYAPLVEFGTRPHKIPSKKKKLRVNGKLVAGDIQHPGSKARPFLIPAFEAEAPNITKDVLKAVEKP